MSVIGKLYAIYYFIKKILFGEHCFSGPYAKFFWDCKNLIIFVSIFAIILLIFFLWDLKDNKEKKDKKLSELDKK